MNKPKFIIVNGFEWEYLFGQIEWALRLTWEKAKECSVEGYNHCFICGFAFMDDDISEKYRCQEGKRHFWLDDYCHQRFIVNNGMTEIQKILKGGS